MWVGCSEIPRGPCIAVLLRPSARMGSIFNSIPALLTTSGTEKSLPWVDLGSFVFLFCCVSPEGWNRSTICSRQQKLSTSPEGRYCPSPKCSYCLWSHASFLQGLDEYLNDPEGEERLNALIERKVCLATTCLHSLNHKQSRSVRERLMESWSRVSGISIRPCLVQMKPKN